MSERIQVLIASPEVNPLAQTGGLADVAGSLPKALKRLGLGTAVIMPAYQSVLKKVKAKNLGISLTVEQSGSTIEGWLLRAELSPGIPAYLIQCDKLFNRPGLYGHEGLEYPDNPERFSFFCKAVLKALPALEKTPDVILANDWQTGLIMPLLKLAGQDRPRGLFAIHNQGYLGLIPAAKWPTLGLPPDYGTMEGLEYFGQYSLLKAGIIYSQAVVTVSPTYADEVQTPAGGHGLDGVMRHHAGKLQGILNGVDYSIWNPGTDKLIAANYNPNDLSGKKACKKSLLQEFGLSQTEDRPLIGMVGRLAAQKGLTLVAEALDEIIKLGADLIILGSGDPFHENMAESLEARHPDHCKAYVGYNTALSHRVIAGSDLVLLPSMYEPCGLVQLYALKYGSVPIVRAVGGLNDTVRDFAGANLANLSDTGFKFSQFQSLSMLLAIRRAVELYRRPKDFAAMMAAGMREDFSWDNSAKIYAELFKKILA